MNKETKNRKWLSFLFSLLGWIGFLFVLFLIRSFLVQSFHIRTVSMQDALHPDDFVLVNKWAHKNNPGRNRIVLFSASLQDLERNPLFVSRCIGMPGDTLEVTEQGYKINGHLYPYSPEALYQYRVIQPLEEKFSWVTQQLKLPRRNREVKEGEMVATLTTFEEYMIREELSPEENRLLIRVIPELYKMVIPRRHIPYRLDSLNVHLTRNAILAEIGEEAVFKGNKLYIQGKESSFVTFQQDYFWLLSDNSVDAVDSRYLGIIPRNHIVGNIWFRWYSKNKKEWFKWIH